VARPPPAVADALGVPGETPVSIKNRAAKQRRHAKTCGPKQRFPNRAAALAAIHALARNRGAVTGQLGVYRCLSCKTWHFGHRP